MFCHQEAPVAVYVEDGPVWACNLDAERRGEPETHGTQSPRGDECARFDHLEMERRPHLVLPHSGGNDRPFRNAGAEDLHYALGAQRSPAFLAVVEFLVFVLQLGDPLRPLVLFFPYPHLEQAVCEGREGLARVRHYGDVDAQVLPNLRRVYVYVDYSSVLAEFFHPANSPVVEAHAHGYQKVGLLRGHVCLPLPVHPDHPQREGVYFRDSPLTHKGGRDRSGHHLGEPDQFGARV